MLRQTILPALVLMLLTGPAWPAQTNIAETAADACRTRPGPTAQSGTHWYYRINRIDNRRCWYLGSQPVEVRSHAPGPSSARRHPGNRIGNVVPDQIAQQGRQSDLPATTEQITTNETTLLMEQITLTDFAARWPDLPKLQNPDPGVIAVMGYADTGAEPQMLSTPVAETYRVERSPGATGGAPSGQAVFVGTLATLLLVASGVVHLARRPNRIRLHGQRGPRLNPPRE